MRRSLEICRQCRKFLVTDCEYECQEFIDEHIWDVLVKYLKPMPAEEFERMQIPRKCEMMFEYVMARWNHEEKC